MISVGQQLGGYTILKRIGGGQMGEVFLAQHRRIARRAAIKTLIPELSAKEAVIERFFNEARNSSQIRNSAIVEILDSDIHDGQAYLIMEFLEGESLGTYLKRVGTLEPDLAFLLGVMGATASAVGAAHDVGIMHRDLKPENIYLQLASPAGPTVTVKVLDFGITQLSREDGGPSTTKSGVMLGSPAYMSPEQCRGAGKTDERSDIYSLGCVLYEALCGRPPFTSNALGDLIIAHISEPPKAPIKLVPDVLPKLNALILKMLAKSPDDRPASMKAVVESLRDCARAVGIDFEAPLEPLTPVERPVVVAGGAPALAIPPEPSQAQAPAPAYPPLAAPMAPTADQLRQPAFARVPASDAIPAAPLPAQPSAAVGRTLILDPSMDQGLLPPRRETGDPLNRLKGLAGQTVMMPDEGLAGTAPPPSKAAKPARPERDEAPRGVVGGTQVLGAFGDASAEADGDDERGGEDDDEPEGRETEHVEAPRGGRRAAQAEPSSTFGGGARSNQKLIVIGAGVVVLAVAILAILLSRPSKPAHVRKQAPHTEPAVQEPPPSLPEKEPADKPAPVAPPAATAPPVEDNVRINLKRVPEGTEISVDGHPATLPILIPRGRETHQIILRAADGSERALDVDGTRDRLIELAMPRPSTPAHAPAAAAPKPAASVRPAAPSPPPPPLKEGSAPAAVRAPAASRTAAPPSAKPAAAPAPADKKAKPRVSREREAIIDL